MPELPIDDELVMFEDGYWNFWPEGCRGGFSAEVLRQIADQLDIKNKAWNDVVQAMNY